MAWKHQCTSVGGGGIRGREISGGGGGVEVREGLIISERGGEGGGGDKGKR